MNKTFTKLFIFTAGAAIGSAVTWKITKDKYARLAQEEVEAMREYYAQTNRIDDSTESEPAMEKPAKTSDFTEQERVDYANLANAYSNTEGGQAIVKAPEIISPSEFGEGGYPVETLNYYADGVVVDEYYDIVKPDDVVDMVGPDFASHFGEYEEDSVFVRNYKRETDYEILKNYENYADVPRKTPMPGYE